MQRLAVEIGTWATGFYLSRHDVFQFWQDNQINIGYITERVSTFQWVFGYKIKPFKDANKYINASSKRYRNSGTIFIYLRAPPPI